MLSPYTIWAYSPKPNTATRDVMREQKRDWLSEQGCKAAAWQQLVRGRAASGVALAQPGPAVKISSCNSSCTLVVQILNC
jgi:hypothetical protein